MLLHFYGERNPVEAFRTHTEELTTGWKIFIKGQLIKDPKNTFMDRSPNLWGVWLLHLRLWFRRSISNEQWKAMG